MSDFVVLLLGVGCAGFGGELFVRGAVGLAHWLRISPGIIGATVAAFATSSPELSISLNAATAGHPQIALGDAIGSNVVNIALILGLALLVAGIQCPRSSIKRDFPVALLAPLLTAAFALDGELSRIDGLLMLAMFLAWITATAIEARKQRSLAEKVLGEHRKGVVLLSCFAGLALLIGAGALIVAGATGLATAFGINQFIIGATIVAIGSSTPELATTIVAGVRGHSEVSLGTILGSNIFNGLLVVALAATIHPIAITWQEVGVTLMFGLAALICAFPARDGFIERRRAGLLLAIYIAYLATLLQLHPILNG